MSIRDLPANTYDIKSHPGFIGEIYMSLHYKLEYSTISWKYCNMYCHSPGPRGIIYFVVKFRTLDYSSVIVMRLSDF